MKGGIALLFYPNREATIVRHSVRKDGDSNPKTANPQTSYWCTPKGKHQVRSAISYIYLTGRRRFPKDGPGKQKDFPNMNITTVQILDELNMEEI